MKISVVTPVYNSRHYIEDTIISILSQQGDFEIEYILVDGMSTDGTQEIIQKYIELIDNGHFPVRCNNITIKFSSESDKGMYDAINKGFKNASGAVYCWLNANDMYLPGTFEAILNIFANSDYKWLKGNLCLIDEQTRMYYVRPKYLVFRDQILKGYCGIFARSISQETVFWRKELWEKVGGIDNKYKYAGDFYLWMKFAEFSPLIVVNFFTSCFRRHSDQKSAAKDKYMAECMEAVGAQKSLIWLLRGRLVKFFYRRPLLWANRFFYPSIEYIEITKSSFEVKKTSGIVLPDVDLFW